MKFNNFKFIVFFFCEEAVLKFHEYFVQNSMA